MSDNKKEAIVVKPKILKGLQAVKIGQFMSSIRADAKANGTTISVAMWDDDNFGLIKELLCLGYTEISSNDVDEMAYPEMNDLVMKLTNAGGSDDERNFITTVNNSKKQK